MLSLCRPCAEKFGQQVGTSVASVWMCVPMDEQRRWISAPLRFTMLWFHALSLKQWKALREKLPAGDQKLRDVQFWPTVHAAVMDLWLATFCKALIWESLIPNALRFGFRAFLGIRALNIFPNSTDPEGLWQDQKYAKGKGNSNSSPCSIMGFFPCRLFEKEFPANLSRLVEWEVKKIQPVLLKTRRRNGDKANLTSNCCPQKWLY